MSTPKRLTRSTSHRIIAGVCGGLAEYLNIDVMVIRLIFVALVICGGSGFLLYIILWLCIPSENQSSLSPNEQWVNAGNEMKEKAEALVQDFQESQHNPGAGRVIAGIILVLIGISSLGAMFFPWRIFQWDFFWPLLIIIVGILIMTRRK